MVLCGDDEAKFRVAGGGAQESLVWEVRMVDLWKEAMVGLRWS